MQMDVRGTTAAALKALGFGRIDVTKRADKLETAVAKGNYDLIIGDTGGGGDRACDIVRGVRHNTVGRDPFLGVILTTTPVGEHGIRPAIDSGADHLLVKPFSASRMGRRIRAIVDARKPFVVTLDYVGPDRRDARARAASAARIQVPNALRAKARGDSDCLATPAAIGSTKSRINHHRIARYDHEVGVLIALITLSYGLAETAMALHLAVNQGATARQISGRIENAVARILDRRAMADA